MKRQKRDPIQRAYHRGYLSGLDGRSHDICPHNAGPCRDEWLKGWNEGWQDQRAGLTGVAGLQNMVTH
ncbi:MAG: ribosome modulation factor [Gammaproteobacteria bacterium]|nr:MAG: ribosome modulation factor [Gammaproteobacteria bacterium]